MTDTEKKTLTDPEKAALSQAAHLIVDQFLGEVLAEQIAKVDGTWAAAIKPVLEEFVKGAQAGVDTWVDAKIKTL